MEFGNGKICQVKPSVANLESQFSNSNVGHRGISWAELAIAVCQKSCKGSSSHKS
jgi:hypothetical protein